MSLCRLRTRQWMSALCLLCASVPSFAISEPVTHPRPENGPPPVASNQASTGNCDPVLRPGQNALSPSPSGDPRWWQTWLVSVVAIPSSALLLWTLLWLYERRNLREKERLERAVAERSAELAKANRELQEVSLCDPLTGVRNRRFFLSMIAADASQAIRAARSTATFSSDHRELIFFFVDIDHFKAVNDEYGHDAGDRVLVQIAARLNSVVRDSDFLIRWGGEEFLVVCRSADRGNGTVLAERILKAISSEEFDLGQSRRLGRTCSVGWAPFPCLSPSCSDLAVDEILRLADRALYLAKQRGRNQAVGLIPNTTLPAPEAKYSRLEQLFENDLIREVCTPGFALCAGNAGATNRTATA